MGAVLDGRLGGGASVPKKSRPRRESAGFVCFGGAGSDFGGGLAGPGPVVLALGGGPISSPKRSCCGGARTGAGAGLGAVLCDVDLSRLCFSLTSPRGMSSSPSTSNDDGSGIGPSITHLFESYFVLIKFSILASDGTWPGANLASQYLFALAFPHFNTLCTCSSVQESRSTDFTRLI